MFFFFLLCADESFLQLCVWYMHQLRDGGQEDVIQ